MKRKNKIKEDKPKHKSNTIKEVQPVLNDDVSFSFKYLILDDSDFSIDRKNSQYFKKMLERLKNLSHITMKELTKNNSQSLRCHSINWLDTSKPNGFEHLNEQLQGITPYQFEISANAHGRVHGFFVNHTFHVVWFDPDHKLYPSKR